MREPCGRSDADRGCASVTIFYPGYVSPDSIAQLAEARTLTFAGIHPPMMSLLWALTDRVVPGPGGLFLLHHAVFLGGPGRHRDTPRGPRIRCSCRPCNYA